MRKFKLKLEIPLKSKKSVEWHKRAFQSEFDNGIFEIVKSLDHTMELPEYLITFNTVFFEIKADNIGSNMLDVIKKYFKNLREKQNILRETQDIPKIVLPNSDWVSPNLVAYQESLPLTSISWGCLLEPVFFDHWKVEIDNIYAWIYYDKGILEIKFDTHIFINDGDQNKKLTPVSYKIHIDISQIRKIIVDNTGGRDSQNLEKCKIIFDLINPPIIERGNRNIEKMRNIMYSRQTRVEIGVGNAPTSECMDRELSDCNSFCLNLHDRFWDKEVFTMLSRLREKTQAPIEFHCLSTVTDRIMLCQKNSCCKPWFFWEGFNRVPTNTNDYKEWISQALPNPDNEQIIERNKFSITYLIECLLSRGAIVKDQIGRTEENWRSFLIIIAKLFCKNFETAEKTLEKLVHLIDERAPIIPIHSALPKLYEETNKIMNDPTVFELSKEIGHDYTKIRKIIITPTRTIYCVPEIMMGNRVLRRFDPHGDTILRVSFRDDTGRKMTDKKTGIKNVERIVGKDALNKFRIIARRKFWFLGASSSQLRDHGAYFVTNMTSDQQKLVEDIPHRVIEIRRQLGNFHELESIPKIMARMGLCFTQTIDIDLGLNLENIGCIHDLVGGSNTFKQNYTFSDGVGCISMMMAKRIAANRSLEGIPSCFQIRYRGAKGIVVVNPMLDERNTWLEKQKQKVFSNSAKILSEEKPIHLALRESQDKFVGAQQTTIGIVKMSSTSIANFNKPLLNILDQNSALHSRKSNKRICNRIEELLDQQTKDLFKQLLSESHARNKLKEFPGRIDFDVLKKHAGFQVLADPFFISMIKASIRFSIEKELCKGNIRIPFNLGRTLFGVVDESNTLQYGQVFLQVTTSKNSKFPPPGAAKKIITGKIVVTKNPCIVAGDVRVLEAVDVPQLRHLLNVIVFPAHGPRPHPDEQAGSDLDGDEYVAIWDKELLLDRNEEPADYSSPKLVDNKLKDQIREVKLKTANDPNKDAAFDLEMFPYLKKEMSQFYVKNMTQDSVGSMATAFLAASDMYGINHPVVVNLGKKCSQAVDFSKTGVAPEQLTKQWSIDNDNNILPPEMTALSPDFQGKNDRPIYGSTRLLGKILRAITWLTDAIKNSDQKDDLEVKIDKYISINEYETYEKTAKTQMISYNIQIQTIMDAYGIQTEAELFSSCIVDMKNRLSDKEDDDMSFFNTNQVIEEAVTNLFRRFRKDFFEEFGGWELWTEPTNDWDEINICRRIVKKEPPKEMKQKAVAFYRYCYGEVKDGRSRLFSFGWLAYDVLAIVRQENVRKKTDYTVGRLPIYEKLKKHVKQYANENENVKDQFQTMIEEKANANDPIFKIIHRYTQHYSNMLPLLFFFSKWADNEQALNDNFHISHLCLIIIQFMVGGYKYNTVDNETELICKIPSIFSESTQEKLVNLSEKLMKGMEFLAGFDLARMNVVNFNNLGVNNVFSRGEWKSVCQAARRTYFNWVFNMAFYELPLRSQRDRINGQSCEMNPFTILLSLEHWNENYSIDDIRNRLIEETGVEDLQLRLYGKEGDRIMVSAKGTNKSFTKLREILIVSQDRSTILVGKESQMKAYQMALQKNIIKNIQ